MRKWLPLIILAAAQFVMVLDSAVNQAPELDADISAEGAAVRAFVVLSREDLQIARGVRAVLA